MQRQGLCRRAHSVIYFLVTRWFLLLLLLLLCVTHVVAGQIDLNQKRRPRVLEDRFDEGRFATRPTAQHWPSARGVATLTRNPMTSARTTDRSSNTGCGSSFAPLSRRWARGHRVCKVNFRLAFNSCGEVRTIGFTIVKFIVIVCQRWLIIWMENKRGWSKFCHEILLEIVKRLSRFLLLKWKVFRMDGNYYKILVRVKWETTMLDVSWYRSNIYFPDYQLASNHKCEKI